MTYDPRPNASGDILVSSRDPIRTNFTILQSRFDENHVNLNGGAGGGKHSFLQMPDQAAAPTTAANEGGVYTKSVSGATQLFYREESNGTERQMTGGTVALEGSIELPGGMIMKWGDITNPGTSGTLIFSTAFPTNIFQVQLTIRHNSTADNTATVRGDSPPIVTQFQYRTTSSSSNTHLFWMAIGN